MAKEKKKKQKPKKSGKLSWKVKLFLITFLLLAIVFLPTTMLLFVALLPSVSAVFFSDRGIGARASTVTAMNLAGVMPFVFKLWSTGNDFEASFEIITNARYITIIYLAAAFGYMIDWVITSLTSSFMYQRGLRRMETIKKRQEVLVTLWGEGVSGQKQVEPEEGEGGENEIAP